MAVGVNGGGSSSGNDHATEMLPFVARPVLDSYSTQTETVSLGSSSPRSDDPGTPREPLKSAAGVVAADVADVPPPEGSTWQKLWHECVRTLELGGPMFLQYFFGYGSSVFSLIFVGHLGTKEMSSAVLGTSFMNVSGFALLTGIASALETLCGQAYGAGQYELVGISLQTGILVCSALFAAMLPVWWHFEPVMIAMGQQADLAAGAARYMKVLIPSMFFGGGFQCLNRYLSAQSIVNIQTYAAAGTILLAPGANYFFIYTCKLGLDGAALANVFITGLQLAVLLVFIVVRERRLRGTPMQTWHGWTLQAFHGWWGYLCLAAPGAAMILVEWSTFEMMVLLAGLLPNPEVTTAAMGWLFNISTLAFLLPLGISGASSTRVSNALGAGRPDAARVSALAAFCLALSICSCVAATVLALRNHLGFIFSSDQQVISLGASALQVLALAVIGDGINATMSGVVRGCGQQLLGAGTNFLSYWLVGVPLSALMAFRLHWGVHGLWGGLLVATSLQAAGLSALVARFDWHAEAGKAAGRVQRTRVATSAEEADHREEELLDP